MGYTSGSDYFRTYLADLKSEGREHSEVAEREAHAKMQSEIEREEDPEVKEFMQETVKYYCQNISMLLSYIYNEYWHQWVEEQRALQEDFPPIELFTALESIVANQCDSSGYTKMPEGPRYPLTLPGHYTGSQKVRNVDRNVSRARFLRSYYRFGVHNFSSVTRSER